ncbi:hypothetical protein B0H10DRAFT_1953542 [Mycena sp. CBHHK59/15]|nr:hypothetical protein B0H10DRAFT_1953542 [Mycena sp. CBHHK59/15]
MCAWWYTERTCDRRTTEQRRGFFAVSGGRLCVCAPRRALPMAWCGRPSVREAPTLPPSSGCAVYVAVHGRRAWMGDARSRAVSSLVARLSRPSVRAASVLDSPRRWPRRVPTILRRARPTRVSVEERTCDCPGSVDGWVYGVLLVLFAPPAQRRPVYAYGDYVILVLTRSLVHSMVPLAKRIRPPQRARTNGTTASQLALLPLPRLPPAAIRRMHIASIGSTPSRESAALRRFWVSPSPHRSAPRMLPLVAAPARDVRRALVAGAQEMDSAHAVECKPARFGATPRSPPRLPTSAHTVSIQPDATARLKTTAHTLGRELGSGDRATGPMRCVRRKRAVGRRRREVAARGGRVQSRRVGRGADIVRDE